MMVWIILGTVCTGGMQGMQCHEVRASSEPSFQTETACETRRVWLFERTAAYFKMRCDLVTVGPG